MRCCAKVDEGIVLKPFCKWMVILELTKLLFGSNISGPNNTCSCGL